MTENTWNIDPQHSAIRFSVRHMVFSKVHGRFAKWSGKVDLGDGDLSKASAEIVIDVASIDTGEADRDAHLRSADFLNIEQNPELTFRSRRVEKQDETHYRMIGDLSLNGETREVALDVEHAGNGMDPWGNERSGFNASVSLNRKDFGLGWNQLLETGGVLVGEKVDITIELQLIKAAAEQAA